MTRAHDRLIHAYLQLVEAHLRRGWGQPKDLDGWTIRKFGAPARLLTTSQMRTGRRCLNAWRHSIVWRPAR